MTEGVVRSLKKSAKGVVADVLASSRHSTKSEVSLSSIIIKHQKDDFNPRVDGSPHERSRQQLFLRDGDDDDDDDDDDGPSLVSHKPKLTKFLYTKYDDINPDDGKP